MNDRQNALRERFNSHIQAKGLKVSFICRQFLKLDDSLICRWRHGQKELWEESLDEVEKYLDGEGA